MADSVNMTLDDIIKQSRASRSRGRGGTSVRGRGGVRGGRGRGGGRGAGGVRGAGGGRGGRGGGAGAPRMGRSRSRGPQPADRSRSRARSQSRGRSQNRSRSQSNARSRSRQRFRSNSRARSASRSRSQNRGLTPRGRAGLENIQTNLPQLVRNRFNRGNQQNGVHSRLGMTLRRGNFNNGRPLAMAKRGISKRGRGLTTNRYSAVGLRSDQILQEQRRNYQNNQIRSQTFTRSRNNSFSSPSQLTVSVANDFPNRRRRNSVGNAGYLNKQSLANLNNQFGGYNVRRGPGSVKSMASNRSYRSNKSNKSNVSNTSTRSRGRGRGRGMYRGVGRKFVRQTLNPKLQSEIAAIQGKSSGLSSECPDGVNFSPTPSATTQTLHERFAST